MSCHRRNVACQPILSLVVGAVLCTVLGTPGFAQESLGADNLAILGQPHGQPISGDELDQRTEELTSRMRCPVCQGLSIAASDTAIAMAMKEEVRQFLAAGYTEEQVFGYFEASYGEFIRLEPKAKGFNLVVWIAPIIALLIGIGVVVHRLRERPAPRSPAPVAEQEERDPDLEAYRERVRREVTS